MSVISLILVVHFVSHFENTFYCYRKKFYLFYLKYVNLKNIYSNKIPFWTQTVLLATYQSYPYTPLHMAVLTLLLLSKIFQTNVQTNFVAIHRFIFLKLKPIPHLNCRLKFKLPKIIIVRIIALVFFSNQHRNRKLSAVLYCILVDTPISLAQSLLLSFIFCILEMKYDMIVPTKPNIVHVALTYIKCTIPSVQFRNVWLECIRQWKKQGKMHAVL